jgi:hypothetical protein
MTDPEPLSDAALARLGYCDHGFSYSANEDEILCGGCGESPVSAYKKAFEYIQEVEGRLRLAEAALESRSPIVPFGNLLTCGYCRGNGYPHTTGIEHHADCTYMAWREARAAEEDTRRG